MPIIRVPMLASCKQEQKRHLVQELTTIFVKVAGGNPQTLHVVTTDVEKGDWGSGGELCSDKFPV